jgi:4-hydroxy-tetrahydrodipicolinate synthase
MSSRESLAKESRMSLPEHFSGIVPPVVTPFTEDGEVDVSSLERLLRHLMDGGVHGLFVLGSSAEMAALSDPQREQVMKVAVNFAAGEVPVLAGVIDMGTASVVEHARSAERLGVDAVVATAPYYIRPNQEEIKRHFRTLNDAIGLPVIAYDIPPNIQVVLERSTIVELAHEKVIVGLKDSSGNEPNFRGVVMETRDIEGFAVFTGAELTCDYAMLAGADGIVPGLGNVDPAGYVRLYELARAGKWDEARAEQERLYRLFDIIWQATPGRTGFTAGALGGFKTALQLLGVISTNAMAPPMTALDDEETARIRAILTGSGLL